MSRFRKLSHTIWHFHCHIVWVLKYRYRVLDGPVRDAAYKGIHSICGYSGSEVVEMNVQKDHIHLVVMVPPKIAISDLMGRLKGQTAKERGFVQKVLSPSDALLNAIYVRTFPIGTQIAMWTLSKSEQGTAECDVDPYNMA